MNASAANLERVVKSRDHHDKNCPFGGKATQVRLAPFDLDRLGWDDGDVIAGLVVVSDPKVQPGRLRVTCDAEHHTGGASSHTQEKVPVYA